MHTFKQFCDLVNGLARGHADDLNVVASDRGSPFRAVHHDYPPAMLAHFHKRGITPTQALEEILTDAASEMAGEALCS